MDKDDVFEYVLEHCRQGTLLVVAACLVEAGDKKEALLYRKHTTSDGEIYSPFLLAVRSGHTQLVRLLLEQFQVDQSRHCGALNFDGYLVEGASPLWCASANGYLEIVKLLIEHKADVNKTTTTNSTPLRAACFHGKLSVVKYLMDHGADPRVSNRYKNTCLMVSCYRGNLEVVKYLLQCGVDSNAQATCGGTALHLACESGNLNVVQALVEAGCDITIRNKAGMTASMMGADACQSEIVEYFTKHKSVDKLTKIILLELLGASYANDKDHYNTDKTYHYLVLAMHMRNLGNIPKDVQPAIEAYNFRGECETVQQLQAIRYDQDALHMEALIVRERILGQNSLEIIHPIVYRGAVYADGLQFNRCIKLWRRALHLRQLNRRSAHNDLLRFAEVFSQMVMLSEKVNPTDLLDVIECCIEEVKRSKEEIEKYKATIQRLQVLTEDDDKMDLTLDHVFESCAFCDEKPTLPGIQASLVLAGKKLDTNLQTLLYILFLICRIEERSFEKHKFGCLIYKFLKLDIRSSDGSTLLHMAVNEKTPVDDFHVKDVCSFPDCDVTKFLLTCGANPNLTNFNGDSPLHIIVQYEKPISDFITLHQIITSLVEYGAHFDSCNKQRKCPLELSTTGVAEIVLKTQSYMTLKCLAAKALRRYKINYQHSLPKHIEEFVDMH